MLSENITVCLICHNEEKRIEYAIRNFKDKLEILVVDDIPVSTDRTQEICKKYGVRHIALKKYGFVEQPIVMNAIRKHIKTEYMLMASCADYFPDELLSLYAKVANEKKYDVVSTWRVSVTAGKHLLVWGDARKRRKGMGNLRFSKKGSIDYENNPIHKEGRIICPDDRVLKPSSDPHLMFYQFRDYDASWSEVKHGQYADIEAMQRYASGERYSFLKMISRSLREFIVAYFVRGSWKQGHLGFMHAYYRFHLYMGIHLRIWDIEHSLEKEDIIKLNNSIRNKLLSKEISVESLFN